MFEIPSQYDDGMNLFQYGDNNPTNKVDPYGLYNEDTHRDLTRFLAEAAGFNSSCCDKLTAEVLGDETQLVDEDGRAPGFYKNLDIHFATESNLMLHGINAQIICSPRLIGTYLHSLEDSFSHQKGTTSRSSWAESPSARMKWHMKNFTWPDKRSNRPILADKMAREVFDRLIDIHKKCCKKSSGCSCEPKPWGDIDKIVEAMNRID